MPQRFQFRILSYGRIWGKFHQRLVAFLQKKLSWILSGLDIRFVLQKCQIYPQHDDQNPWQTYFSQVMCREMQWIDELSTDFCKSTTLTGTYTVSLQCIKIPGEVSIGDFKMHKRSVLQMLSNSLDKWDYRIPGHKYWDVIPTFPSTLKKLPPNKWSICHPPFLPLEKKTP
jgi:hypothetical protein